MRWLAVALALAISACGSVVTNPQEKRESIEEWAEATTAFEEATSFFDEATTRLDNLNG